MSELTTLSLCGTQMQESDATISALPLEILVHIATYNYGYVYHEMLAVPQFARFALENQEYLERRMVRHGKFSDMEIYMLFGRYHSVYDRPAAAYSNGHRFWCYHGMYHRDKLPAVVFENGISCWYQYDKLHRDGDLPAVICPDGTLKWYQNGELHRNGKPAICYDGANKWYENGNYINIQ